MQNNKRIVVGLTEVAHWHHIVSAAPASHALCLSGNSNLVVLLSLKAVAMYSDSLFSIKATLIQARP